jgi:hypothetical protein
MAGSQAEQRDMHTEQQDMSAKLDNLVALVGRLRDTIVTNQLVNTGAHIELHQSILAIQLSQIVNVVSTPALADSHSSFQACLFMRNKRRLRSSPGIESLILRDIRIQRWAASSQSSLIIVKGTHRSRFCIQDFCKNVIELLLNGDVPALWILRTIDRHERSTIQQPSTVHLLKALISQALKLNCALHTDYKLSSRLQMYLSATTESEWFALLASMLEGLPRVYVVIDIEALGPSHAELAANFSWAMVFLKLFQDLRTRGIKTLVKVVLVSYGSPVLTRKIAAGGSDLIVQVGGSIKGNIPLRGKVRSKISGTPQSNFSGRRNTSRATPGTHAFGKLLHKHDRDVVPEASIPCGIPATQEVTT